MRRDAAILIALYLAVAVVRVTAPSDIATGDQPLQAANVRDVVERGNWIVQHSDSGAAASKPPLYNWLAAPAILATGVVNDFTLKIPGLLAGLAALLLTWDLARRLTSREAALAAGVLLVCSTMFSKHLYFVWPDMLLTALVVAQFWAAATSRPGLYWSAAALALLAKGPLGLILPILALSLWWWREGELRGRWKAMRIAIGLPLALLPFAIWFAAALTTELDAVWNEMVIAETVDRFAAGSKSKEHRHVLYYVPHFLLRMAPASVLAIVACFKRRERDVAFWWFLATFLFLSLIPSKRADRLFPLFPAACILAGWTFAHGGRAARIALRVVAGGFVAGGITAAVAYGLPIGGTLLAVCGAAMLLLPGCELAPLAAAMLVLITTYQHALHSRVMTAADLRYPIGPFVSALALDAGTRERMIGEIAGTPARLRDAVASLDDAQLDTPYREGGWTLRQVAHHLPDSHLNGYIRLKLALTEEEPTIKPYEEGLWAELADTRETPVETSLTLLEALHARFTTVLRSLGESDFARTFVHPAHGRVTVDWLVTMYAWHGRHHVAHITSLRGRNGW